VSDNRFRGADPFDFAQGRLVALSNETIMDVFFLAAAEAAAVAVVAE
jgi:hypothetical protein